MFAAGHLRDPRRDRAILAGSLVALSGARLAGAVGVGGVARTGATSTTTAASRRCRVEAALFVARLGPDDRRDDAALERAARGDVRGARRPPAAAAAASSRCCSPATSSSGARSGWPPGSWTAASTPRSTRSRGSPQHPQLIIGHHARDRRPVAVQPAAGPLPRRVPQPARLRHEPLARASTSGASPSRWASPTARSASAAAGR